MKQSRSHQINNTNSNQVTVKGLSELSRTVPDQVTVTVENNEVRLLQSVNQNKL